MSEDERDMIISVVITLFCIKSIVRVIGITYLCNVFFMVLDF